MFQVKVDASKLGERLDAGFYHPEYLALDDKLDNLGAKALNSLVDGVSCGPFGGNAIADDLYSENGVNFIRPLNITSNIFDDSSLVKVPKSLLLGNGLKVYNGSNLYFGRVGVPCVALIEGETSISPNIIIAKLHDGESDSGYLHAFCSSLFGLSQLKRQLKEVAQPTTSTDAVRFLKVYCPNPISQKYIGDKVRQAEQLRAWAKVLYRIPAFIDALIQETLPTSLTEALTDLLVNDKKEATKELTNFLSLKNEDLDTKQAFQTVIDKNKMGSVDTEREFFHINTVATDAIDDFLSAQTYRPAITEAFDIITSAKHYKSLQAISLEPIRQGATPKFSSIGKKCIKSKQTRDLFLDETGYETVDPDDEQNKRIVRLRRNDILVTRQGAGTVGRASIFMDDEEVYITDSLFLVRIDSNKANPAFIAGFLRTYTGQRLIEKGVYGSTGQLNLSSGALRNLPVPDVDLGFQNFLGEALSTADTLFKLSTRLTQAAKTLVEALIEGQLTESQLVSAQQALEAGDESLDRALLERMTAEGIDGEGDPLFDDIEQLYDLLEQANQALDADDTMAEA
ncbi:hypothetical protein [Pseudoalteromonas sp. Of11M-6]|uniref:hypothetical protein n=1 Tax=Pseudoalteromonas sp. Of11M-6 TaxID=2917754 RepID=UPI001EF5EEDF|nr:hypothetical protein [Pseudoalteromonas sp. Of11M-6]MCG7553272.1 hypothetical protein [Pseudoalteromonas sp. Of11M-6]